MAVKAKAEITLASIRDVKSTTRYYQSSRRKLGKNRALIHCRKHQQPVLHRPYGLFG